VIRSPHGSKEELKFDKVFLRSPISSQGLNGFHQINGMTETSFSSGNINLYNPRILDKNHL
jgi:hypothetical protein